MLIRNLRLTFKSWAFSSSLLTKTSRELLLNTIPAISIPKLKKALAELVLESRRLNEVERPPRDSKSQLKAPLLICELKWSCNVDI
jgi:hypothetical protein